MDRPTSSPLDGAIIPLLHQGKHKHQERATLICPNCQSNVLAYRNSSMKWVWIERRCSLCLAEQRSRRVPSAENGERSIASEPSETQDGFLLALLGGRPGESSNIVTVQTGSDSETEFDKLYNNVFCDKRLRRFAFTSAAIDSNFANSVQRTIQDLVPAGRQQDAFFPPVVVSYATGHREKVDAQNSGPGFVVVACLVRFLFANRIECYSDFMLPAGGRRWTGTFMNRIDHANVMIVVLCPRLFRSVACLEEIHRAKERGLLILPITLQDCSMKEESMWNIEDLESYAKRESSRNWENIKRELVGKRFAAIDAIRVQTIPGHGTFLSDPGALGDLVVRLQRFCST